MYNVRRIVSLILLLSATLFLLVSCLNPDSVSGGDSRFFDDFLLFGEDELKGFEERITSLKNKAGMDIVFLTASVDTDGMSEDYGEFFLSYHGFGKDTLLVFIDMKNKKLTVLSKGAANDIIGQSEIKELKNLFNHCFTDGSYSEGVKDIFDYLEETINERT